MVHKCKDLNTFIKENDDKSTEYLEYLTNYPKDYDCSRTQWQDANHRYLLLVILYLKKIP